MPSPHPISSGTARSVLHTMGVAVQQAVMYGPVHNVSRLAAREAAATLAEALGPETGLEVAVAPQGAGAIVNGESVSSPDSAGQAFLARLEAHGVHELHFDPGFESSDAETFLALLAARPDSSAASGGFRASLERALPGGSVRVVESHWRKVGDDGAAAPARLVHLCLAYWGFVLLSVHLGLHLGAMLPKKLPKAAAAAVLIVMAYGAYAFVRRGFFDYLLLRTAFVFLDHSEPVVFFLLDYLAVMALIAGLAYWLQKPRKTER